LIYLRAGLQAGAVSGLVLVLIFAYELLRAILRAYRTPGLIATAGGLSMALNSAGVQVLLLIVFAVAFYIRLRRML
jgi:hypothetical protein